MAKPIPKSKEARFSSIVFDHTSEVNTSDNQMEITFDNARNSSDNQKSISFDDSQDSVQMDYNQQIIY